jgi:hypothetical protein
MCASRSDRSSNFRRGITDWQIKLNVILRELVTAALGGTRFFEGSLGQRTIAPTLSERGFHFGELKNPVSERQGASRRGRNLSETGFLSFCVQCCLFLGNIPPACSMQANSIAKSQIDWALIGAGSQALTRLSHIVKKSNSRLDKILAFDPSSEWLTQWRRQFAAWEIGHLRSPSVHHRDPNPYELRRFAENRSSELFPPRRFARKSVIWVILRRHN